MFFTSSDTFSVLSAEGVLEAEHRRGRELGLDFCQIAACGVFFLLLLYFFDLVEVFFEPSSSLNRFFVFSASGTGVVLILLKFPLGLRVLRIAWPWVLIVAWLALTTRWAGYPDVSRTRVLAFAMMYLAALGVAVGFRSPRVMHATLATAFGVILLADLVSLDFEDSYTEIGLRGIHKHKNAAGFIASAASITIAFAFPQMRSFGSRSAAVCVILASVMLLILTELKTSFVVVAVAICLTPLYWLWVRCEPARRRHLVMTVLACTFVFAVGASGTKISKVAGALFGDPTLTNRMAIWSAVQEVVDQSPWRGHGYGSIWDVGDDWNSLPSGEGYVFYNDADLINEAHNGYLDLLLNGGWIGLVLCWFVALRALWFSLILATSNALPRSCRWTSCMLHCLLAISLVRNLTESVVFFPASQSTYFFIFLVAQVERWKVEFDAHCAIHRQCDRGFRSLPAGLTGGAALR